MKKTQVNRLFAIALILLLSVQLFAQQSDTTETPVVSDDIAPPLPPSDAETELEPIVEEPSVQPAPQPRPHVQQPRPIVREVVPVVRPEVLDAWDNDFLHKRIAGYLPGTRDQIVAAIDEPALSDGDSAVVSDTNGSDDSKKNKGFFFKSSLANLAAWLALVLLIIFIFVLYNFRNGKRRRKVFRNIPSRKRSLRNKYNKYNKY